MPKILRTVNVDNPPLFKGIVKRTKMTKEELAVICGCTTQNITRIDNGTILNPGYRTALKLLYYLELSKRRKQWRSKNEAIKQNRALSR